MTWILELSDRERPRHSPRWPLPWDRELSPRAHVAQPLCVEGDTGVPQVAGAGYPAHVVGPIGTARRKCRREAARESVSGQRTHRATRDCIATHAGRTAPFRAATRS